MEAMVEVHKYAEENTIRDEDGLTDLVDGLCSMKKKEGRWVTKFDIVREDSDAQLAIEKMPTMGVCKNECLTVQRACENVLKDKEEKLVSFLLNGKSVKEMKKSMCKATCKKTPPKLGKW